MNENDIYDDPPRAEMDVHDLKGSLESGTLKAVAGPLCQSGAVNEVGQKADEPRLLGAARRARVSGTMRLLIVAEALSMLSLLAFGIQAFVYFKTRQWPSFSISNAITWITGRPVSLAWGWERAEQVAILLMDLNVAFDLLVAGLFLLIIASLDTA